MLGVIAALPSEAKCLLGRKARAGAITRFNDVGLVYVCGIGTEAAEAAARLLIEHGCTALVSWGTAGGLHPQARSGSLVIPRQVTDGSEHLVVDSAWQTRLIRKLGDNNQIADRKLLTSVTAVCSQREKLQLWDATAAEAVDMESFAVAKVALNADIPFVILRAIVDPADFVLPEIALEGSDEFGRPRWRALIRGLIDQPQEVTTLYELSRQFQRAKAALHRAAHVLGPMLERPTLAA